MPNATAKLTFQPEVSQALLRGFEQIVGAIRPTLGPNPRLVAYDRAGSAKVPELLDDGGLIARRIIQLPDRNADVGAMFLRHALWSVHQEVGDGVATAAVIFEALYRGCLRYLLAGGNAMLVRRHLEDGARLILAELDAMARPLKDQAQLAQVAWSLCYDSELAAALGEIFDILGPEGHFETRTGRKRDLSQQYVLGSYWNSQLLSQALITDPKQQRAEVHDAYLLITDRELEDPRELFPVFDILQQAGGRALMVIALKIADPVVALLLAARREGDYNAIAAKTPGETVADRAQAMEDLAILTGGRPYVAIAGDALQDIRLEHLGRARRAWVDRNYLGIVGGKGSPTERRARLDQLRNALSRADDARQRDRLRQRIGRLLGGSALLTVGASTEPELEARKALAGRTARALRGAVRGGVVAGGGKALLDCRRALALDEDARSHPDRRAAFNALDAALQAPFRTLAANAGYDASRFIDALEQGGPHCLFDVQSGQVVGVEQAGVWDAVEVVKTAAHTAISSAALALTTDVIVQHKRPKTSTEP